MYLQHKFLEVKVPGQRLHAVNRFYQVVFPKGHTNLYTPLATYESLYFPRAWPHSVFSGLDFYQCGRWNFQSSYYDQSLASFCMSRSHSCSLSTTLTFSPVFFCIFGRLLVNRQKLSYLSGKLAPDLRGESQILFFFAICPLTLHLA